jgi:TRAP-type C4-dicarboxylate transport system substrate-binding protein
MRWLAIMMALALVACTKPQPAGVTTLTYASPYAPTHPFSRADKTWIDNVEMRSHGTLRIRPIWSGALLSADMSMEELRHGVADIGLITPIYVKGGTHLIRIQSGFASGADSVESQAKLYRCIASSNPEIGHELDGLQVLAVQGGNLPGIVTRNTPVRSLADLRGLRLRAPTELLTVLGTLGADPVNMPMGQVYSSMAKGVIDGVIAPADTFKSMHFSEIAHHYTNLAVPRGAYPARAMGMKRWRALTEEQRQILLDAVPVWEAALAKEVRGALKKGFEEAAKSKVEMIAISPEEQARFDALYLQDAARNARALLPLGIDGPSAFVKARASVKGRDQIACGAGL